MYWLVNIFGFMGNKVLVLNIQGSDIKVISDGENSNNDYLCLTDIAHKFGSLEHIKNWLQNKNTIDFLGIWEQLNNPSFNLVEFHQIKNEAGLNRFIMSVKKWSDKTNAIGLSAKTGKYNSGTYAHKDIAMEFCSWLSPEFKLYIIKEFQRLKEDEAKRNNEIAEWDGFRWLTKVNYRIHTDAIQQNILPLMNITQKEKYIIYASEADLLNIAVFGMKAGEFAKKHSEKAKNGKNIRDYATTEELIILNNLESSNAKMIRDGLEKETRFNKLVIQKEEEMKSLLKTRIPSRQSLFNQNEPINQIKQGEIRAIIHNMQKENPQLTTEQNKDFEKAIDIIIKKSN